MIRRGEIAINYGMRSPRIWYDISERAHTSSAKRLFSREGKEGYICLS